MYTFDILCDYFYISGSMECGKKINKPAIECTADLPCEIPFTQ